MKTHSLSEAAFREGKTGQAIAAELKVSRQPNAIGATARREYADYAEEIKEQQGECPP